MKDFAIVKIAEAIIHLRTLENYTVINKGDFKNAPPLEGYYVDLKKIFGTNIYLILNNSKEYKAKKNTKEIDKYYFIVLNLYTLEDNLDNFIKNLEKHSNLLITLFEKLISEFVINLRDKTEVKPEDVSSYDLPYGYKKDEKGKVIVEKREADMVRKIFVLYSKYKSMKKVATDIGAAGFESRQGERVELGVVSGILHDGRYMDKKLPQAIVPISVFNKTQEILKRNVKENKNLRY